MKKGIATETLVKLLICLLVLAILTYLIYRYVLHPGLDPQTCAARMTAWCTHCEIAGFSDGPGMGDELKECIDDKKYLPGVTSRNSCGGEEGRKDCEGYLP